MQDSFHVEVHRHDDLTPEEVKKLKRLMRDMPWYVRDQIETNIITPDLRNKVKIKIT
jgi:uncharacterized protein YcbK (DUF882 family)